MSQEEKALLACEAFPPQSPDLSLSDKSWGKVQKCTATSHNSDLGYFARAGSFK